jgi:hypothetical protein
VRTITCAEADELAVLGVLDALTPEEAAPLHAHLATCPLPHDAVATSAGAAGALALSVDPIQPPAELRARVMATIARTPQVADTWDGVGNDGGIAIAGRAPDAVAVTSTPPAAIPGPVPATPATGDAVTSPPVPLRPTSVVATGSRVAGGRRPDRWAWVGLAAAAVLVLVLAGWNLSLQQQLTDRSSQVGVLEAQVAQARQDAQDADTQVTALQQQLSDQQDQLTAALDQVDRSEAQVASLRDEVASTQADLVAARQTLADTDARVALAGQAVAAAADPSSALATLRSAQPGFGASGMAVFPASGQGYIMLDGLPPLEPGTTYQAWYLAGGTPTSAGLLVPGPQGLTVLGGLDPGAGTDTIALTVEPEGGVPSPTGPVVVAGQLAAALQG